MQNLNQYIEHTALKPTVTQADIERLLDEARQWGFCGVCVPPYWVKKAARDLKGSGVRVVTVAAFPFGFHRSETKQAEIAQALKEGADEIDLVFNLTAFKSDDKFWPKMETSLYAKQCHEADAMLKVILETAYLSDEEIVEACRLCADAGADFVKTSTGYGPHGATVEHVRLMRQSVKEEVGVKASGGIRSYAQALAMIEAGAERLGTSSGVAIMQEAAALS